MMSEGIHHLPVLDGQNPIGIITLSDILRTNNVEPLSLIRTINYAHTVEDLSAAAGQVPGLVVKLIERDTRAVEIGEIITSLTDSMTRRLLVLAAEKFGVPPCDYAWLAFGSQARQEQVLGSDQDNGLLLPDSISAEQADYFRDFAEFVNGGLDKCGMPYCPGDIMAKNEKWRMNLKDWKTCFAAWIEEPSPKALMHSSIFFDMRHIAGNVELSKALLSYVLERAQSNTIFLALMCENSLLHSPPLGFFKTFVLESDGDHNHTLELKKRGTIPVVDIARNYALSVGVQALNTIERLKAIEQTGAMSKEMAYSLIDAHEFIAGIRLEAQAREYRAQQTVDNYLDPKELSPLVRHQLKDAFHLVREAQNAMKVRFSGGIL
jgi:CBS domain-containing protein